MTSLSPRTPVFCPGESRVHRTALEELGRLLGLPSGRRPETSRAAQAPPGSVHLALLGESPVCLELAASGAIVLHNQPPGADPQRAGNLPARGQHPEPHGLTGSHGA